MEGLGKCQRVAVSRSAWTQRCGSAATQLCSLCFRILSTQTPVRSLPVVSEGKGLSQWSECKWNQCEAVLSWCLGWHGHHDLKGPKPPSLAAPAPWLLRWTLWDSPTLQLGASANMFPTCPMIHCFPYELTHQNTKRSHCDPTSQTEQQSHGGQAVTWLLMCPHINPLAAMEKMRWSILQVGGRQTTCSAGTRLDFLPVALSSFSLCVKKQQKMFLVQLLCFSPPRFSISYDFEV